MGFPKLKSKAVLAPLEEITNIPFRLLCQRYGAGITYTQQLSAIAIIRENKKSLELIKRSKDENLVGLQLFGRNPEILLEAAGKYGKEFNLIDLNLGCPSKKIVEQGYGSALLKEKNKIFEIVNALASNLNKPVTVKMRSGFKKAEALELVKEIERAGAAAITLHARTKEQGYSGHSDWELIKKVKSMVEIPIIGNGDVVNEESAKEMLEKTKCDYIMIGRAAMKNPFIFKRINYYLETGRKLEQKNKIELFKEYYELCKKHKIENLFNLKQTASNFTQGMENSSKIREKLQKVKNAEEIFSLLNELNKNLN
ncbi:tRNA-dihydrouridine synthase family protein [Candidatus Woesearchaeota archaeon]|nr:tRNA-dihydrouridine synthase family protein [Candidatus Woesearchaeota archaeon]